MNNENERIEHSVTPEMASVRSAVGGGKWLYFAAGLVLGGIATYLLDPKDGAQRRASIKSGTKKYSDLVSDSIGNGARSMIGARKDKAANLETPEVDIH